MADKVGYGSPPRHTRWKKGQSGNPSGRPKGTLSIANDLMSVLAEVIQITEGGKSKRITKFRAVLMALANRAIKGDPRAANFLINLAARVIEADASNGALPAPSAHDREIVEAYVERKIEARMAKLKDGKK